MENTFDLTILIPAKDEEKRLPIFLTQVISFSKEHPLNIEIIVIDDGSQDKTADIVHSKMNCYPGLKLISLESNRGKGFALRTGLMQACGAIVVFFDADGSTPVTEIDAHVTLFSNGVDIVAGSRVKRTHTSSVQALFYRRFIGFLFTSLIRICLIRDFSDTQCGFKMFRQSIIKELVKHLKLDGFGFDMELLYVAKHLGLKIEEVPVNWHHVDGSKVNLVKDSFKMFLNIFQVKSMHPLPLAKSTCLDEPNSMNTSSIHKATLKQSTI